MITDTDIEKLKETFVTKSELKESIKEAVDASTDTILKEFNVLLKMIGDLIIRIDATNKRLDEGLAELRANRIVVGDHERRMERVESRLFRQA